MNPRKGPVRKPDLEAPPASHPAVTSAGSKSATGSERLQVCNIYIYTYNNIYLDVHLRAQNRAYFYT